MWLIEQMAPGNPAYHIPVAYRIAGDLDVRALEASFNKIIERHEVWRTTFREYEGDAVQEIHPECRIQISLTDLRHLPIDERAPAAGALASQEAVKPFDLGRLPLIRVSLFKLDPNDHVLLVNLHHIVGDGLSLNLMFDELDAIYRAESSGAAPRLPELTVQYAAFAVWQRENPAKASHSDQLDYWQQQLKGDLPLLEFPADKPRPVLQSFIGSNVDFSVPKLLVQALTAVGTQEGCTFFVAILAAFQVILLRYSKAEDILIGTPVTNRTLPEIDRLIGNFLNILALRCDLSGNPTFIELLRRSRETTLNALSNKDLPFEMVVKSLKSHRDPSRSPVFQVLLQILPAVRARIGDLSVSSFDIELQFAQFDLALNLYEEPDGGFRGRFQYCTDLFAAETMERLSLNFVQLLNEIGRDPLQHILDIPVLGERERNQLLVEWNDTCRDYPAQFCLHTLIEAEVVQRPDAIAVTFEDQALSYRDLNRRANRMAHRLRSLGVGPDVVVAVAAERSIEMVIGLLAVLKAGGAYLPLDVSYPAERLAFMLSDAQPRALLVQRAVAASLPSSDVPRIFLEDSFATESDVDPALATGPDDLAYVIYTSGSTGRPKGVMNTHRGIVNRLLWMQETYGLAAKDRSLQKTTCAFDVSVWEFFWPLLAGARLVMARPGGQGDTAYLVGAIRTHGITTLHFVPSMLAVFLEDPDAGRCASLRRVICSGEALPFDVQERFFSALPGVELHNLYGPTEAAVDVTFWPCQPGSEDRTVPIGRPVANTSIYILDEALRPVPVGVAGELAIGGVQVARGYLGRPELTAEKFVPNPFGEGRLYRTGDLARYRADGVIEYLGRLDHQVKLRGFRIELGEIEDALRRHPAIRDAAVVLREDAGEKRLAAYCVPRSVAAIESPGATRQTLASVTASLRARLPDYMAPAVFVFLDHLPLSANGKLDRRALPAPDWEQHPAGSEFVAPRTETEEKIASAWRQILKVERIGVHDDFFDLGGHSLAAMQVVSRLRGALSSSLNVLQMFEHPTIAGLAETIDREPSAAPGFDEIEEGVL
jgi:amino acid adenylation domain-containing protein